MLAIALVSLASCAGEGKQEEQRDEIFIPQNASTDVDLTEVEALAKESCSCAMRGGDPEQCDAEFRQASERILASIRGNQSADAPAATEATACAPISTAAICFGFSDKEECITTAYRVVVADPTMGATPVVCTEADARALEKSYDDAFIVNGKRVTWEDDVAYNAANERGLKAINDMLRRIRAGEKLPKLKSENSTGCV
jgi:hypothetical protein